MTNRTNDMDYQFLPRSGPENSLSPTATNSNNLNDFSHWAHYPASQVKETSADSEATYYRDCFNELNRFNADCVEKMEHYRKESNYQKLEIDQLKHTLSLRNNEIEHLKYDKNQLQDDLDRFREKYQIKTKIKRAKGREPRRREKLERKYFPPSSPETTVVYSMPLVDCFKPSPTNNTTAPGNFWPGTSSIQNQNHDVTSYENYWEKPKGTCWEQFETIGATSLKAEQAKEYTVL